MRPSTWSRGKSFEGQELELGPLTTFDVGTALSLLHFARAHVQIAVVEVGVGGANDATNVLEPIISLIGPIGLDHVEVLGHSLREVALQKFGVARRGVDLLVGRQDDEPRTALLEAAERDRVKVHELGASFSWSADDPCAGPFDVHGPVGPMLSLDTPLLGTFQRDNAAMAVGAAQILSQQGWPISEDAIRRGLTSVEWPGRFQTVVRDPLTVVDGAHNPTATRALAATAAEYFEGRDVTLVLGMSDTKDVAGTLAELAPVARRAIVTRSAHPRATDPKELATAARSLGMEVAIADNPAHALQQSWERQSAGGASLVTGSLFVVGDVLEWLWQLQRPR
jgi:dihydrofolate synthase / folylpolyglutamate synthase